MDSRVKQILAYFSHSEICINVHYQFYFWFSFTHLPCVKAYNFAVIKDLKSEVQHYTYILDRLDYTPNILRLFLTSKF